MKVQNSETTFYNAKTVEEFATSKGCKFYRCDKRDYHDNSEESTFLFYKDNEKVPQSDGLTKFVFLGNTVAEALANVEYENEKDKFSTTKTDSLAKFFVSVYAKEHSDIFKDNTDEIVQACRESTEYTKTKMDLYEKDVLQCQRAVDNFMNSFIRPFVELNQAQEKYDKELAKFNNLIEKQNAVANSPNQINESNNMDKYFKDFSDVDVLKFGLSNGQTVGEFVFECAMNDLAKSIMYGSSDSSRETFEKIVSQEYTNDITMNMVNDEIKTHNKNFPNRRIDLITEEAFSNYLYRGLEGLVKEEDSSERD